MHSTNMKQLLPKTHNLNMNLTHWHWHWHPHHHHNASTTHTSTVKNTSSSINQKAQKSITAYLNSSPPNIPNTYESKHLAELILQYKSGTMSTPNIKKLTHLLRARLRLHETVTLYVRELEIQHNLPQIEEWEEEKVPDDQGDFLTIYWMVLESGLLGLDPDKEGHSLLYYLKPARYLAYCMYVAEFDVEQVEEALVRLGKMKLEKGRHGSKWMHGGGHGVPLHLPGLGRPVRKGWDGLMRAGRSVLEDLGKTVVA